MASERTARVPGCWAPDPRGIHTCLSSLLDDPADEDGHFRGAVEDEHPMVRQQYGGRPCIGRGADWPRSPRWRRPGWRHPRLGLRGPCPLLPPSLLRCQARSRP
jgi:hypothetical protein